MVAKAVRGWGLTTLAVVSAIGSLGVGAFIGAVASHLLRERADRKQSERERVGLLRLINLDIILNENLRLDVEDKLGSDTDYLSKAAVNDLSKAAVNAVKNARANFRTDAWEDSRVRLAKLLPAEDFKRLSEYYVELAETQDSLSRILLYPESTGVQYVAARQVETLYVSGERVHEVIDKHTGESD